MNNNVIDDKFDDILQKVIKISIFGIVFSLLFFSLSYFNQEALLFLHRSKSILFILTIEKSSLAIFDIAIFIASTFALYLSLNIYMFGKNWQMYAFVPFAFLVELVYFLLAFMQIDPSTKDNFNINTPNLLVSLGLIFFPLILSLTLGYSFIRIFTDIHRFLVQNNKNRESKYINLVDNLKEYALPTFAILISLIALFLK